MSKGTISYDKKGFIINGKREFLIGGEFHYFRVPAASWEDRLQKMKRTGANLISVYIPWSMHEPEEGKERWTGDYDVKRFLELCRDNGLYVLIKPGPYVCAELDFGGHPDWLIGKVARKEIKLRMPEEGYLKMCKRWYERVSEIINPFLVTNGGNIIAIQIENEYDHLMEYGEESISPEDAINYFLFLKRTMEELGIDIPKFANEAAFLRGRDIIDTRTYYPNIPGLWMWEFDLFEGKIIDSKKAQTNSPIMILELQAGWFAQIGAPIYEPQMDVVEGVSKSVLIQGASVMNYYMLVGGTTFPFMGARGDTFFLGGLGNITSYDFGGSPVKETGEIHKEKFHWIKGFTRFSKEFSRLILDSDGKSYVSLTGGGEDVAVLGRASAERDVFLDRGCENFKTYEEGNEEGRFFFIRNLEDEEKYLSLKIQGLSAEKEYNFHAAVKAKETKMLPVNFTIPGTSHIINYSTSEVLLSRKYDRDTVFVLYGKKDTQGELCINVEADRIKVTKGHGSITASHGESVLRYIHSDISIVRFDGACIIIVEEGLIGKIEELERAILIHDGYYVKGIEEREKSIAIDMEVKEGERVSIRILPIDEGVAFETLDSGATRSQFAYDGETGIYTAVIEPGTFEDKPVFQWVSDWKYCPDTEEISESYDHQDWVPLDKPISLEEAGFFQHGYYWYRTQFQLDTHPVVAFMDYVHNDTDRIFIYINEQLVHKSHNKKIKNRNITGALKPGTNTVSILYANEFHNKSHPHEGALVKYSGIMNPIELRGIYHDGREWSASLGAFGMKMGLSGMDKGYHTLEYEDADWKTVPEARKIVVGQELGHIVWLRRKFRYDFGEGFSAPLLFETEKADQRLTIYVNGMSVARYDILGPQQQFYIPEAYLKPGEENVIAMILECPAFYDELQMGHRRGYVYDPEIKQSLVTKSLSIKIKP